MYNVSPVNCLRVIKHLSGGETRGTPDLIFPELSVALLVFKNHLTF